MATYSDEEIADLKAMLDRSLERLNDREREINECESELDIYKQFHAELVRYWVDEILGTELSEDMKRFDDFFTELQVDHIGRLVDAGILDAGFE